jgi:hypothetical protein
MSADARGSENAQGLPLIHTDDTDLQGKELKAS